MEREELFVDFSGITEKEALHGRLRENLPLPSWYGNNLDALYDALTDMSGPVCIHFSAWERTAKRLPGYMKALRHVLKDAQMDNPGLSFVFEETEGIKERENE